MVHHRVDGQAGRGLVFNEGERVWGFTSPAYYLLYKHRPGLTVADGLQYRALKQFDGCGYMPFMIMEKCVE